MVQLYIEDIDSKRMVVHIRQGKGGKDRDMPLCPKLLETFASTGAGENPQSGCFRRLDLAEKPGT
jgi:integrase/recombinase XerD